MQTFIFNEYKVKNKIVLQQIIKYILLQQG